MPDEFHFRPNRAADGEPCNLDRALRAEKALQAYIGGQPPIEEHYQDLLTDLMHFACWKGINFDADLASARANYAEER